MLVVFEVCQIGTICNCQYEGCYSDGLVPDVTKYRNGKYRNHFLSAVLSILTIPLASIKSNSEQDKLVHRRQVDTGRPLRLV
jgi:hypothetical protein